MGEVKGSIPFRAYQIEIQSARPYDEAMSDHRADLVLELLRAMRGDTVEIKADLVEIKQRLGLIEA